MRTPKRLWRTEKAGELVLDGDPKARFLAYGEDREVAADDQEAARKALGGLAKEAGKPADKQAPAPANKKGAAPANKAPRRPAPKS